LGYLVLLVSDERDGGSLPISRPADNNFYACSSRRRIRLQADVFINRIVKTLLAPEASLRRLNGNVAEQELNLI
jgi:hypothetical protein